MGKIMDLKKIEGELNEIFERLKSVPLNQKLIQLADGISENLQSKEPTIAAAATEPVPETPAEEAKDFELTNYVPQYDTLFSFVNSEQVDELKGSALKHFNDLQVGSFFASQTHIFISTPIDENRGYNKKLTDTHKSNISPIG